MIGGLLDADLEIPSPPEAGMGHPRLKRMVMNAVIGKKVTNKGGDGGWHPRHHSVPLPSLIIGKRKN